MHPKVRDGPNELLNLPAPGATNRQVNSNNERGWRHGQPFQDRLRLDP
jgi:hypothetical protein